MLNPIRLLNERPHSSPTLRHRAPHAAVLTFVLMLSPGLVGQTRAADIDTPVVSRGYVATDASEICTFWDGLGTERPFVLTDDYGRPVSWKSWIDAVNYDTYDRFFGGLEGLIFLASPTGQAWFRSPTGQAWAHSPDGREWINEFVKGAPADRSNEPVEYVRICDAYGSGYYYIPGTETCLKIGGYVRPEIRFNDYDSLRSALQPTTSSPFSEQALQDLARAFTHSGVLSPSSTPQQDTNQPGSNPAGRVQVEATQDDSGWSGKIRVQRDFGGGSGGIPPSQTSQQNGNASGANGTTTPAGTGTQAGTPSDGMVTFRIFVKGQVPEGSPPGPAIPGQFVSLVGGNVEPDLPASGTTRTAEQENMGADKGAPLGKSDQNGVAEFRVDYGDIKYLMGNSYLRDALTLKANYTLNGSIDVQKHGGFVAPAPDNTPAPDFTKGSLDGVSYRWNEFSVGTQKFWEGGYSVDYNVNVTPEQVKQDIIATLRDELGPGITVAFDGNVCRIELPARVTGPYSPVPQKFAAGIPEATIQLGLAPRRDGGTP